MIDDDAVKLETFGERVRQLRKEQGLSQKELAEKSGMNYQVHISRIEQDLHGPSLKIAVKIAAALGSSIDWLATGREHDYESQQIVEGK